MFSGVLNEEDVECSLSGILKEEDVEFIQVEYQRVGKWSAA